ncbi:DUF6126 family protein [Streptomyces sp. NPDC058045]|uniref:DUF6126 family protein n=1 Tax=Streptomyces sp. NPDC058045 TaxID=3346311 RepID=UPI0036F02A02
MNPPVHPEDDPTPQAPVRRMVPEDKLPRSIWIRLVVYVVVVHGLAAFLYLLFKLGAESG